MRNGQVSRAATSFPAPAFRHRCIVGRADAPARLRSALGKAGDQLVGLRAQPRVLGFELPHVRGTAQIPRQHDREPQEEAHDGRDQDDQQERHGRRERQELDLRRTGILHGEDEQQDQQHHHDRQEHAHEMPPSLGPRSACGYPGPRRIETRPATPADAPSQARRYLGWPAYPHAGWDEWSCSQASRSETFAVARAMLVSAAP